MILFIEDEDIFISRLKEDEDDFKTVKKLEEEINSNQLTLAGERAKCL